MILDHPSLLQRCATSSGRALISIAICLEDGRSRVAREFGFLGQDVVHALQEKAQVVIDPMDLETTARNLYEKIVSNADRHADEDSYIRPFVVLAEPNGEMLTYHKD